MGPVMADASVGGIHMRGFFTIFPICSILVPIPWEMSPLHLFSRKLIICKTHHLGAAAGHCSSACQSCQSQSSADGGAGDGKCQGDSDDDGHQNSHEEGLQLRSPHNQAAYVSGGSPDGRSPPERKEDTHENRNQRSHKDIDAGFFGDGFSAFGGQDGDDKNGQRTAGAPSSLAAAPTDTRENSTS